MIGDDRYTHKIQWGLEVGERKAVWEGLTAGGVEAALEDKGPKQ